MKNRFSKNGWGLLALAMVVFIGSGKPAVGQIPDLNAGTTTETQSQITPEQEAVLNDFRAMKFKDALDKLDAMRAKDPDMAPSQLIMADLFLRAQQPQAARQAIEETVTKFPTDPEAYIALAQLNLQNRCVTEAELLYTRGLQLLQNFSASEKRKTALARRAMQGMAQVFAMRGKYKEATQYLGNLLKSDPKNIGALDLQAQVYFQDNNVPETLKTYQTIKSIEEKALQPEIRVALLYHQKDAKANAKSTKEYISSAVQKTQGKDLNVLLVASQLLLQMDDVKNAAQYAEHALKVEPNSLEALLVRGNIALFEKNFSVAEANFQKAYSISPSNFGAVNGLALAMCEQGGDKLKKAEEYALVNLRSFNREQVAYGTAAWVLYKKGEYTNALQLLQQATELTKGQLSPDTAFYLAAVFEKLGNADQKENAKKIVSQLVSGETMFMMRKEAAELNNRL